MDVSILIHGIGSAGMFSSRAFLPAFLTACALRYGDNLPSVSDWPILDLIVGEPTWFTHGYTITALGCLSALEIAAEKIPEARAALSEIDRYTKPTLAALALLGIISGTDLRFIEETMAPAGFLDYFWVVLTGGLVYGLSTLRALVLGTLRESDEDDNTGLLGILSWAEDLWALLGVFALLLFPVAMIALNGIAFGVLLLLKQYFHYREEKTKCECARCGESIYASAMECPHCRTAVSSPSKIGFFGQAKSEPTPNIETHPFRLAEKKRCPVCATRFTHSAKSIQCQVIVFR